MKISQRNRGVEMSDTPRTDVAATVRRYKQQMGSPVPLKQVVKK